MRFDDYLRSFRAYDVGAEAMPHFVGMLRAMRFHGRDFEMLRLGGLATLGASEDAHDAVVSATGFSSKSVDS